MKSPRRFAVAARLFAVTALVAALPLAGAEDAASAPAAPPADPAKIARGAYFVTVGGCNDCHTPWKEGPNGPELDMTRMLSGHPETMVMPPPPAAQGPWIIASSGTNTAHAGPWGVSFTANLTPDPETGTGKWTEEEFKDTLRSGRHLGRGRQILPPMPWFNYGKMTDDDLSAVFAYLRSIPPVKNRVPDPLPPVAAH